MFIIQQGFINWFIADYPKVPATIFLRHPTMSKDEIQRITAAVSSDITSLVDTFTAVKERIDPYQPINETEQKDASPNSTRRQKQVNKIQFEIVDLHIFIAFYGK